MRDWLRAMLSLSCGEAYTPSFQRSVQRTRVYGDAGNAGYTRYDDIKRLLPAERMGEKRRKK